MDWWLILGTPAGPRCWPIGDDPAETEGLLAAARVLVGFPADETWADDGSGWDVQVAPGQPHDKLLERATVGALADLRKVDPGLVAAHQSARAEWSRARNVEAVALILSSLDEVSLAAVLADPAVADRVVVKPKGG